MVATQDNDTSRVEGIWIPKNWNDVIHHWTIANYTHEWKLSVRRHVGRRHPGRPGRRCDRCDRCHHGHHLGVVVAVGHSSVARAQLLFASRDDDALMASQSTAFA